MNATRHFGNDLVKDDNATPAGPASFFEFAGLKFKLNDQDGVDQVLWSDAMFEQDEVRRKRKRMIRILAFLGLAIATIRLVLLIQSQKDK